MAKAKGSKSVSREDFIGAIYAASAMGRTYEDVATDLGLVAASVVQRAAKYRKLLEPLGKKLPNLAGKVGGKKISALDLGALCDKFEQANAESQNETVTPPAGDNVTA